MKNEQLRKLLVLLARKLLPLTFAVFILQIDRWELFTCLFMSCEKFTFMCPHQTPSYRKLLTNDGARP